MLTITQAVSSFWYFLAVETSVVCNYFINGSTGSYKPHKDFASIAPARASLLVLGHAASISRYAGLAMSQGHSDPLFCTFQLYLNAVPTFFSFQLSIAKWFLTYWICTEVLGDYSPYPRKNGSATWDLRGGDCDGELGVGLGEGWVGKAGTRKGEATNGEGEIWPLINLIARQLVLFHFSSQLTCHLILNFRPQTSLA